MTIVGTVLNEQKQLTPADVLNYSYIYRELSKLFINKYIPGPHVPFSVNISRWRIDTLYYHRFVIIDPVDKRLKLNERSFDITNSGNQKHEGHDLPCFNLLSSIPGTMHTMLGSERNRSSFYVQPSTLSTYYGLKTTTNTIQYFYFLTQHKLLSENAVVPQ